MGFDRFSPGSANTPVGRVVEAEWDSVYHGIRFTLRFDPSGRKVSGVCRAGNDPVSGRFVTEAELRAFLPRLREMIVYQHPSGGDPNTMSPEEFRRLTIEVRLADSMVTYRAETPIRDANSFISRVLR